MYTILNTFPMLLLPLGKLPIPPVQGGTFSRQESEVRVPDIRQDGLYVLKLQKKEAQLSQINRPCYCVMTLNSGLEVTQGH